MWTMPNAWSRTIFHLMTSNTFLRDWPYQALSGVVSQVRPHFWRHKSNNLQTATIEDLTFQTSKVPHQYEISMEATRHSMLTVSIVLSGIVMLICSAHTHMSKRALLEQHLHDLENWADDNKPDTLQCHSIPWLVAINTNIKQVMIFSLLLIL